MMLGEGTQEHNHPGWESNIPLDCPLSPEALCPVRLAPPRPFSPLPLRPSATPATKLSLKMNGPSLQGPSPVSPPPSPSMFDATPPSGCRAVGNGLGFPSLPLDFNNGPATAPAPAPGAAAVSPVLNPLVAPAPAVGPQMPVFRQHRAVSPASHEAPRQAAASNGTGGRGNTNNNNSNDNNNYRGMMSGDLTSVLRAALSDPSLSCAASLLLRAMGTTGTLGRLEPPPPVHHHAPLSLLPRMPPTPPSPVANAVPSPALMMIPPPPVIDLRHEAMARRRSSVASTGSKAQRGGRRKVRTVASRIPESLRVQARRASVALRRSSILSSASGVAGTINGANGHLPLPETTTLIPTESPQSRLDSILRSRGYPTTTRRSLDCRGYKSKPTDLRLASYGTAVLRAVHRSDAPALSSLLAAGLSPNPCNAFNDDVMHVVCKNSDTSVFRTLIDAGASVHVADSLGRTPLHHACWSDRERFEIVAVILDRDPDMLRVSDGRGRTPLDFVSSGCWSSWIEFLEGNADRYWPARAETDGTEEAEKEGEASLEPEPKFLPIDPADSLPPDVALKVAAGKMAPEDAAADRFERKSQTTPSSPRMESATHTPVNPMTTIAKLQVQKCAPPMVPVTAVPPMISRKRGLAFDNAGMMSTLRAGKRRKTQDCPRTLVSRCA